MKILIVNDDGIGSDGIARLAAAAVKLGDVWVVAPESQRSAASHSINLRDPIDVHEHDFPVPGVKAYAISGSPADCVRLGVLNIVPGKPDVVLSGINFGFNAGTDVQYSATVGAAMEAIFQNIPAIALSEGTEKGKLISQLYIDALLPELISMTVDSWEIVNVNFPDCEPEELKGILFGRTASRGSVYADSYEFDPLPDGGKRYHVVGTVIHDADPGSDLEAIYGNYISIGTVRNIG